MTRPELRRPATRFSRWPLWRDPLVHFLAAGALIFALDGWRGGEEPGAQEARRIVVPVAQVERLAKLWQRTWGRPPSEAELQGAVRDHIRDEIYAREARRLGLDTDDTVIRRRLRQKMEFFLHAQADARQPQADELAAFHRAHQERYTAPAAFSFTQIPLGAADEHAPERAARARARLMAGADPARLGTRLALPRRMEMAAADEVARAFGTGFAEALKDAPPGQWHGPVRSGLGVHLVRLEAHRPARPLALEDARAAVLRDWQAQWRKEAEAAAFEALRAGYEIVIENPAP